MYFNGYYDHCLDDLLCLSIDKLFNIPRNDIIISFYTNHHCFNCVFSGIMSSFQKNNGIIDYCSDFCQCLIWCVGFDQFVSINIEIGLFMVILCIVWLYDAIIIEKMIIQTTGLQWNKQTNFQDKNWSSLASAMCMYYDYFNTYFWYIICYFFSLLCCISIADLQHQSFTYIMESFIILQKLQKCGRIQETSGNNWWMTVK